MNAAYPRYVIYDHDSPADAKGPGSFKTLVDAERYARGSNGAFDIFELTIGKDRCAVYELKSTVCGVETADK